MIDTNKFKINNKSPTQISLRKAANKNHDSV